LQNSIRIIASNWWKEAVVYQIYPRSFKDANGDGIGDLAGIFSKVDYLTELGVDAVWLSPINTSPMFDFGYDISDYRAIDPVFGSMADFDALVAALHKRNIRLLLDLVVNHTSHLHPWFVESRASRESAKRDWYIWHDGRKGTPPNNWQSVFGGSAWEWDETTESYYLHSFLKEQPDLNWRNPQVKDAVFADIEFWLKKGVDGFRLDVVNCYYKDKQFRDNPLRLWGWRHPRPYELQHHVHDMSQPEMHPLLRNLRQLLDKYDATSVGEVLVDFSGDPELAAGYLGRDDELHMTFDFTLLDQKWDANAMANVLRTWLNACGENWPTLAFNNHDRSRSYTRYAKRGESSQRAKILAALLLTMKGTPYLYYGEEIGMKDGSVSRAEMKDPVGIRYWPLAQGRDPARTPMLWDDSANGGFTSGTPWLPVNDDFAGRNVASEKNDSTSLWHWYRELLSLRKQHAALRLGDWKEIYGGKDVFAYRRTIGNESIDVFLNFSAKPVTLPPVEGKILLSNCGRVTPDGILAGYEVMVVSSK